MGFYMGSLLVRMRIYALHRGVPCLRKLYFGAQDLYRNEACLALCCLSAQLMVVLCSGFSFLGRGVIFLEDSAFDDSLRPHQIPTCGHYEVLQTIS